MVCRRIVLNIPVVDRRKQPTGEFVQSNIPTRSDVSTEAFLSRLFPGHRIEHVGRQLDAMSKKGGQEYTFFATSLFFRTVQKCFMYHHPLTLRPEVLMYLIVHEIAVTVNKYPEEFRHLFTRSSEKANITVRHDGLMLGEPGSPWHEAISLFNLEFKKVVPPGIMKHLLPRFSTATPETEAASLIAFMDAAKQFYDYDVMTLCGIPDIRLAGTPTDYFRILSAASMLAEVFAERLGRYFTHLLPVLKTLSEQADGAEVDESFWRSIYTYESQSGGSICNGWLTAFLNYQQMDNYFVEKEESHYDWKRSELRIGAIPAHVSSTPFLWHYLDQSLPMSFAGGVLAVDLHDGSLMPGLSYAVLHADA